MEVTATHRLPATVLSWTVLAAYPICLVVAAISGTGHAVAGPQVALPVVVLALPAILLPRWPVVGFTGMLVGVLALAPMQVTGLVGGLQAVALDLAVGYLAATRSRLASVGAAAAALTAAILSATFYLNRPFYFQGPFGPPESSFFNTTIALVLGVLVAWLTGTALRQRRDYRADLLTRAATEAVTNERLRIARDLHDQVAHSIGIIAIQAGVGRRVIETQPEEARKALDTIETTSRDTLAGLRRTLVALRRNESEPAVTATAGLAELDRLIAATEAGGVRATVRIEGEARPLPADLDLAAYRIIQEALTNVVRHAHTETCMIILGYAERALRVEVTDAGRGGTDAGGGYGIPGMRERVALIGGELTAGPHPEGGFQVVATLPVPA